MKNLEHLEKKLKPWSVLLMYMYLINEFNCIYNSASHYCYTALLYALSLTCCTYFIFNDYWVWPLKDSQWGKVTPAFQIIKKICFVIFLQQIIWKKHVWVFSMKGVLCKNGYVVWWAHFRLIIFLLFCNKFDYNSSQ